MRHSLLFSESINIKQNGDRLYIALAYRLFQKAAQPFGFVQAAVSGVISARSCM
jgi:hypothetical protein